MFIPLWLILAFILVLSYIIISDKLFINEMELEIGALMDLLREKVEERKQLLQDNSILLERLEEK